MVAWPNRHTGCVKRQPMPGRLIGLVPVVIGVLGLLATIATASGTTYSWTDWAFGPVLIVLGLGLLFSQRWAWAIAVACAIAGVLAGAYLVTRPGDIALPGANIVALLFYLVPCIALLAVLARPRTLRWFHPASRQP